MGSVVGRHCKFQHSIPSGHLLKAMSGKWSNGPILPICLSLLCHIVPLLFSHHSSLRGLTIIHSSIGTKQNDVVERPFLNLSSLPNFP